MRAAASARAVATPRGTRVHDLRCEAPLLLRQTAGALYLVAGAAGPLGGDELSLSIDVGCGATLRIRSAAATLAQPGPHANASSTRTNLTVGAGGALAFEPEPLVSVRGSHHLTDTSVALTVGSRLLLVEEVLLGRFDEPPGRVTSTLRIQRDGRPLVAHDLDLGAGAPGAASAAVVGDARAVRTEVHVGSRAGRPAVHLDGPTRAAAFPVTDDTTLVVALAPSITAARAAALAVAPAQLPFW